MTAPRVNEVVYALMNAWLNQHITQDIFEARMRAQGFSYPYIEGCVMAIYCLIERQDRRKKK